MMESKDCILYSCHITMAFVSDWCDKKKKTTTKQDDQLSVVYSFSQFSLSSSRVAALVAPWRENLCVNFIHQ